MRALITFLKWTVGLFMVFATILGAVALDLDDNVDSFVLSPGDKVVGSFIIDSLDSEITTDFDWISIGSEGTLVTSGYYSYNYEINVPEDADIGVYNAVIKIVDDSSKDYLNIKISVQNNFFKFLFNKFKEPLFVRGFWILSIVLVIILLIIQFMRKIK